MSKITVINSGHVANKRLTIKIKHYISLFAPLLRLITHRNDKKWVINTKSVYFPIIRECAINDFIMINKWLNNQV